MTDNQDVLNLYNDKKQQDATAQVILNGYNVSDSASFGQMGQLRSFKIVTGELWDEWRIQTKLTLRNQLGHEAQVRIAALPAEEDGYGLMEFLK